MKKKMVKKTFTIFTFVILSVSVLAVCLFRFAGNVFAQSEPEDLEIFRKCYPDVSFEAVFDSKLEDWKVTVTAPVFYGKKETKKRDFYWAGGRLLPEEKLDSKNDYWTLIYPYSQKIKDPSEFSQEEIERARKFGHSDNRKTQAGTPMFFYDFLYAAKSQVIMEDHIKAATFLGKKTKIHERLYDKLKVVEAKILYAAETDSSLKEFIASLKSCDAYNWRIIGGTERKSFHSYGIAIDILPKKLGGKTIFWNWEKERNPENWMLVPLKHRWLPHPKVMEIFHEEGWIWGGNWIIYDNMHFEYHPEIFYR